jgi:hypothetical protein
VLLDRLGGLECDAPPFAALSVVDAVRARAMLFLLARAPDGRDGARVSLLGGAGFVSFVSVALVVTDLVVIVFVREDFEGEPMLKFHTFRTTDLAEERNPKRGVALPLSTWVHHWWSLHHRSRERKETYCSQPAVLRGSSGHICRSFSSPFFLRASFA